MSDLNPNSQPLNFQDVKPLTDGWHYPNFRDGKHDENYIEWKYFNFKQKDIAGYIVYLILDPERKTKLGKGLVSARVFHRQKFSGSINKLPIDKIQIDGLSAAVDMDGSKILEKDQHNWEINGKVDNLSWDLHYEQQTSSIDGFKDISCGIFRWEKASWLIKMPRAKVKGTIKTNDGVIEIDAMGYSDANWGKFMPLLSKYEWGQYNDERITFIFGVLYKLLRVQSTYFYLIIDNEIVRLENPKFIIKHSKWGTSRHDNIKIPLENEFVACDKQYSIRFTSQLVDSDLVGLKISTLLPKSAVSEQIVEYKGVIEKNGKVIYEFDGLGFQERSIKTWKNPLITI